MSSQYKDTNETGIEHFVRPEFDSHSDGFQVYHDADWPWKATTTLVLSLSSVTNVGPTEMLPLNRAVDPDVLESHVRGRDRGATLTFEFHGHQITVRESGTIEFVPVDEQEP